MAKGVKDKETSITLRLWSDTNRLWNSLPCLGEQMTLYTFSRGIEMMERARILYGNRYW